MKPIKLLFAFALATAILAGCGGGGNQDRSGRASIAIQWPEPGRLIPKAANFVRVRAVNSGGTPVGSQPDAVGRPLAGQDSTTLITVTGLPVGETVTFIAEAFKENPNPPAPEQVAQARGQQSILIRNDAPNTFDISMASSVAQIAVFSGATPVTGTLNVIAGEDIPLTAQAQNANGAMVLVDDSNWSWTRSGTDQITFSSQPSGTGPTVVARGHATIPAAAIQIQETEASKIRSVPIQVVEPTYTGFVDEAVAGGITPPDITSGDSDTRADIDRLFRLEIGGPQENPVVSLLLGDTLQPIPSPPAPWFELPNLNFSDLVRNKRGIALAIQAVGGSFPTPAAVGTWRDNPVPPADAQIVWGRVMGSFPVLDIAARNGFTYLLQDMTASGAGFRVTKMLDDTGATAKEMFVPGGVTPLRMTVDDEGSLYFVTGGAPFIVKMDKNGDVSTTFSPPTNFVNTVDIDFDRGLIFVLDDNPADTSPGSVRAVGMNGASIRTVPTTLAATEEALRITSHNRKVYVLAGSPPRRPINFHILLSRQ